MTAPGSDETIPAGDRIPVSRPFLTDEDLRSVEDCLSRGWVSSVGPYVETFEKDWAHYCDRRFGVAVSNGTVALELAVAVLGLGPEDEIVMPAFTIISCALAAIRNGCTPVLVDADPETWCMDVSLVEAALTPSTKAIMPVHMYGHPVDMAPILDIATDRGLKVIEDAAEAHGAHYTDPSGATRTCGSFGDVSCFSFYANKLVTTGEGGMLLTDDRLIAERAASMRNLGFGPGRRFSHELLGYNFRLTNPQAALALHQVRRIEEIVRLKRTVAQTYGELLAGVPGIVLPVEREWARSVYWMYGVVVNEGVPVAEVTDELDAAGIETRPFFLGLHEQPVLRRMGLFGGARYPVTEQLAARGFYLPSGIGLTRPELERICRTVGDVMARVA